MSSSPPPRCPTATTDQQATKGCEPADCRRRRRFVARLSPGRPQIAGGGADGQTTTENGAPTRAPAQAVELVEQYIIALLRDLLSTGGATPSSRPPHAAAGARPTEVTTTTTTIVVPPSSAAARGMRTLQLYRQSNVAAVVCELLTHGVVATQRDVYYRLEKHYASQLESNAAIHHLALGAGVPRRYLNIVASGRGAVGGCVVVDGVDLRSIGPQGMPIDGSLVFLASPCGGGADPAPLLPSSAAQHQHTPVLDVLEARFLLIVEKDAVFYRLMQERIFDAIPVILLSGFGFPSAAARALAWAICRAAQDRQVRHAAASGLSPPPPLEVFGLVDYNPSGVQILLRYMEGASLCTAEGGAATGPQQKQHDAPVVPQAAGGGSVDGGMSELRWLGLRSKHLLGRGAAGKPHQRNVSCVNCEDGTRIPSTPLTDRDRRMLTSLLKKCSGRRDDGTLVDGAKEIPLRWHEELLAMSEGGRRADIEASYAGAGGGGGADGGGLDPGGDGRHRRPTGFADSIVRSILQRDAI